MRFRQRSEWETATDRGEYRPDSLFGAEGFVHASLDQTHLHSEIRWEEPEPTVEAFPHIYGPVNLDAVVMVEPFECGADGRFDLPEPIREFADRYAAASMSQPPRF